MRFKKYSLMFLGAAVVSTGLMGCVEDEAGGEGIDHRSAQQAIKQSLNNVTESIANSLGFLEESDLFTENYNFFLGGGVLCDEGDDFCEPQAATPFDPDKHEAKDELIRVLENHVFHADNIEREGATSVTYLLKGTVVCGFKSDMEADERANCEELVDDAQIRLVASSPAQGKADLSVQLGPDRIAPVKFEFHPKLISVSPNIGEIKKAADYLAPLMDADSSGFPDVAKGELRLAVEETGTKQLQAKIGITQAIEVSGGEWGLELAASPDAFVIAVDGLAKTLTGSLGLGAISALFPYPQSSDEYGYDDDGNLIEEEDPAAPIMAALHIGGLYGSGVFEAGKELLALKKLGLGDKTTTLDLNGKRVLSIDLNAEDGRRFDVDISKTGQHTQFEISPAFDLRALFAFAQVQNELENIAAWMKDEILSVKFTGAPPAFEMISGNINVVSGKLTLSAEKAGIHHVLEAGQCLIQSDSGEEADNTPVDPFDEQEPSDEPEFEDSNPMDDFEVGTCG